MKNWFLGLLLCGALPLCGGEIRIDLSTFVSSTPGNWNNISNLDGTTSDLIDFATGLGTGVSISGVGWRDFYGDDGGEFPNQSWLVQPATEDAAGMDADETGVFTLSGLTDSAYIIEVVSARTTHGYLNSITVNGSYAGRTFLGTPVNTPWNAATDGLAAGNWLIWDNVIPDAGQIRIIDVAGPGTLGIVNALRVSSGDAAVPEPSTLALTAICALAMLLGRRRG